MRDVCMSRQPELYIIHLVMDEFIIVARERNYAPPTNTHTHTAYLFQCLHENVMEEMSVSMGWQN